MATRQVERLDLLAQPLFWANHYLLLFDENEEVDGSRYLRPFFGVVGADLDSFYERELKLNDPTGPWPLFDLPVLGDYAARVEYLGEPHHEVRYSVVHPSWPAPILLGYDSGKFSLPAYRWTELVRIGAHLDPTATTSVTGSAAILLLLPSVYLPEDETHQVRSLLKQSWQSLGTLPCVNLDSFVEELVDHLTTEISWRRDDELGWITDGVCCRNPAKHALAIDDFKRLREFFCSLDG